MAQQAKKITFIGRVQGVGFRYSVRELAKGFIVVGNVKNLADGSVEMIVQGEDDEVSEFITEIMEESEVSHHIKESQLEEIAYDPQLRGFAITA